MHFGNAFAIIEQAYFYCVHKEYVSVINLIKPSDEGTNKVGLSQQQH